MLLMWRVLAALLVRENGKILLVRDGKYWKLPAEEVGRETFEDAAKRCSQEIGAEVILGPKLGMFVDPLEQELVLVFHAKLVGDASEINTAYFAEDEVLRMFSSGSIRARWVPKAVRWSGGRFDIHYT